MPDTYTDFSEFFQWLHQQDSAAPDHMVPVHLLHCLECKRPILYHANVGPMSHAGLRPVDKTARWRTLDGDVFGCVCGHCMVKIKAGEHAGEPMQKAQGWTASNKPFMLGYDLGHPANEDPEPDPAEEEEEEEEWFDLLPDDDDPYNPEPPDPQEVDDIVKTGPF